MNDVATTRQPGGPLRVAYVTMLFPASSETFASLDVRELGRKGLEVEVHSLRPKTTDVDRLAQERGVVDVKRTYNGWRATFRGLALCLAKPKRSAAYLRRLVHLTASRPREMLKSLVLSPRVFDVFEDLRRHPPDVVHVYWGHYPALVGYLVQQELPGTVLSMSLGAYDLEAEYPPTVPVAERAEFVRTHGRANVKQLVDRIGVREDRIAVVYNGIDLDLVPPTVGMEERVPGKIVTAGRLTKTKAVDDVLRTVAKVRARHPRVTLEVFGEGPELGRLEDLAASLGLSDAVTFRGHQSQRELFHTLAHAEFFLFMSRDVTERLPNVIKEAMACGAVCVSTDSVGLEELILGPGHGVVIEPGRCEAAARAILELMQDPGTMVSIRENARRHVIERFDVRSTTEAYVARWRAATDRGRAERMLPREADHIPR